MKKILGILVVILFTSFKSDNTETIKLDGIINHAEWTGAKEYELSSGGRLYVLDKGEVLYLGLKGNSPGWSHVYLSWKDTVKVLHASAALGDQLYTFKKDVWKLQKKFKWEVRESVYDDKLIQKQTAYYMKNGWCANNNNTGDKVTFEYKIDKQRCGAEKLKFGVLFTSDAKSLSYFPPELNDNTLLESLISGTNPDNLHFKPSTWIKL